SFELQNILNIDETPVWFDIAGNVTINEKEQIPSGIIVWFQKNGWMDTSLITRYIDYLEGERNHEHKTSAMMVYDLFSRYLEDSVKKKFCENGYDLAVIPGGLTSICQPLDIAINKPYKDYLYKEWYIWMSKGGAGKTTKGNLRRTRISDENISTEIIIRSFEYCGLLGNSDHNKENEELEVIDL
ncbi:4982_t:CDS:2, partial [Scutellospora calospora]